MKNLLLLLFLLLAVALNGQDGAPISGGVIDISSNMPLEYASVSVYTAGSNVLIAGAVTGSNGRFLLKGIERGEILFPYKHFFSI